jgi:hypothetical protein
MQSDIFCMQSDVFCLQSEQLPGQLVQWMETVLEIRTETPINVIVNRLRNHSRLPKHSQAMWQSPH